MAKPINHKELGINADALRILADARLRDFDALWKAGQHHTAVYMAGYVVEETLKLAICRTLRVSKLPTIFEYHLLDSLLFFSGYDQELRQDKVVCESFKGISDIWSVEMRYQDPSTSAIGKSTCETVDKWLNDSATGLVPWFRRRL